MSHSLCFMRTCDESIQWETNCCVLSGRERVRVCRHALSTTLRNTGNTPYWCKSIETACTCKGKEITGQCVQTEGAQCKEGGAVTLTNTAAFTSSNSSLTAWSKSLKEHTAMPTGLEGNKLGFLQDLWETNSVTNAVQKHM